MRLIDARVRLPQRQRDRILYRQRVGEGRRRAMADAGAAIEPCQRVLLAWPAKPGQGEYGRERQDQKKAKAHRAGDEGQNQPQPRPGDHQKQPGNRQNPRQMRPASFPGDRELRPPQGLRDP
jgi:hypothetical protein